MGHQPDVGAGVRTVTEPVSRAPVARASMVRRERLLALLRESSDHAAVVLSAPGGYGKTTLVAQWAEVDPRPFVWLTVSAYVDDPASLADEIVRALVPEDPRGPVPGLPLAYEDAGWFAVVLPALGQIVAEQPEPFVVVLDDAGNLSGRDGDALVETLVDSLPDGSQVVLATRTAPPRPVRRLRSTGRVVELGPQQLAFDADEATQLLGGLGVRPTEGEFRALMDRTEGWPVGLYLLGLSLRPGGADAESTVPALAPGWAVDYIRDELLEQLAPDDAQLLLRCSVLSELTGLVCDAVSGTTGSLARLRALAEGNRLVIRLDPAAERFRLHHLFQDFLRSEFAARAPAEVAEAHRSASHALEQLGDVDGAIAHAREAGDDERLGDLVWSRFPELLGSGQMPVLRRWLDGVDDARLASSCRLAVAAAWVASHAGDMERMLRLTLVAEAACAREGSSSSHGPDVMLLKAVAGHVGVARMTELASAVVAGKGVDDPWLTVAYYLRGVGRILVGDPEPGVDDLEVGARLSATQGIPVMRAHCLTALATVALSQGDVPRAVALAGEARELIIETGMEHIATAGPVFSASAQVYVAEGRLQEAAFEAARALRLVTMMRAIAPWHAVQGRLQLARTYLALGDVDRARVLTAEARRFLTSPAWSPVLEQLLKDTEVLVAQGAASGHGPSTLTTAELRVLQYLPSHLSYPEIGRELFLSRHTVKSQALSSFRKLGVRSRSEAVAAARDLGLLPNL